MTIAATVTAQQYSCNGSTAQFSFPNKVFAAADIVVTLIDLLGNLYPFVGFANVGLGLNYTVQNVDVDTGCLVAFNLGPANGWTLDIRTVTPNIQSTSIKNQGAFLPELHEEAFDKITREAQDLRRLTYTFGIHGPDIENVPWTPVPSVAARKGQYLAFDSNGLPTVLGPAVSTPLATQQVQFFGTDSGTANAYVVATVGTIPLTLTSGVVLRFTAANASTGTATLNAGGTGIQPIVSEYGIALSGGEIQTSAPTWAQWNGGAWQIVTGISPACVRTAAELAAGVMPTNYAYPPGHLYRYGTNTTPGTTDMTTALQNWGKVGGNLIFPVPENAKLNGVITLPSNTTVSGVEGATITQTASNTEIFNIEGKTDISIAGMKLVGVGTDYSNSDSSRSVGVFGSGGELRIRIFGNYFLNFSYTPVRWLGSKYCEFVDNTVNAVGVALTPGSVTSGRCYGVLADAGCQGILVDGNSITKTGQGVRIEGGATGTRDIQVVNNDIFDLGGQHGVYAGSGLSNIVISSNTIWNVPLVGIKCQSQDAAAADNVDIAIIGNTLTTCGDQGILLANGTPGSNYKVRNATIVGNVVKSIVGSCIYLSDCNAVVVTGNTLRNAGFSGIFLTFGTTGNAPFGDVLIADNQITNSVLSAIRDGGAFSFVVIKNNHITDCATAASAGDEYGIFEQGGGTNWTIESNIITDANAKMLYGIYLAAGTMTTYSLRYNLVAQATSAALRMQAAQTFLAYEGNVWNATVAPTVNDPGPAAVASIAALVLPQGPNVISVTGVTNVTSMGASGNFNRTVTLVFTGILTFTNGNNLKLTGNFVTAAGSAITLVCDGTNWFEIGRKA